MHAADLAERTLGVQGSVFISLGIVISTLGFLSQGMLTAPRVYYAMADDGLFFSGLARIHPVTSVPVALCSHAPERCNAPPAPTVPMLISPGCAFTIRTRKAAAISALGFVLGLLIGRSGKHSAKADWFSQWSVKRRPSTVLLSIDVGSMVDQELTNLSSAAGCGSVPERSAPGTPDTTIAQGSPVEKPYVIKPTNEGSSVGVRIVREGDNLSAVEVAEAAFGEEVLIEKFVPGRELTVAIMGDKAVAVTELRPRTKFYDYEAKYTDGITEHLIPAPVPSDVYEQAKQWALMAHEALGCSGLSRADLRWDDKQPGTTGLVMLELNTQPGMTPLSLAPEQAKWAGITWPQLMTWMVEHARRPA